MNNAYSPEEILQIAVKVEERGKKLYEALEANEGDSSLAELWQFLKNQEEAHRVVFETMLDNIDAYIINEFQRGDYDAYLSAIAKNYVFTQNLIEEKTRTLFSKPIEALDFAISVEKESVLIYSAFKRYVAPDKQSVIDGIIAEEERHLVQLTSQKSKYEK